MINPIEMLYPTGASLYAIIHHPSGQVWNSLNETFEDFNAGQWANYAVPMGEQGTSGYYRADYPEAIGNVLTTEAVYLQAGGTPATNDTGLSMGQSRGMNVMGIVDDTEAADNLRVSTAGMARATAVAGTLSTTQMSTNLNSTTAGNYVGRTIAWTSGALEGQVANITGFDGDGLLTFGAVTEAPSAGDTFIIL